MSEEEVTTQSLIVDDELEFHEERGRPAPPGVGPEYTSYTSYDGAFDEPTPSPKMQPSGLWHLKTKAESRAQTETVQVWTVELPARSANNVLNLLRSEIKGQDSIDLQHLRRFAKARFLPAHLLVHRVQSRSPAACINGDKTSTNGSKSGSRSRRRNSSPSTLYLLICPTTLIDPRSLSVLLKTVSPFWEDSFPLLLNVVTVPLFAPTSPEQAEHWTKHYWPTMYRKTNPFGPHPTIINKAEEELVAENRLVQAMELAKRVADETHSHHCGESIGCVIIERPPDRPPEIVAVAGDGRHYKTDNTSIAGTNIMAHAVMRAIGMVARKRVRLAARSPEKLDADMSVLDLNKPSRRASSAGPKHVSESLLDYPLTAMERNAFDKDNIIANGYLCVDLEIYLTHEPCMMCSMAILHSRFSRCVFGQRMPQTGALIADAGLGHGLFWRSELNWKLLCWEWNSEDDEHGLCTLDERVQV